jgi:hypothetical protein
VAAYIKKPNSQRLAFEKLVSFIVKENIIFLAVYTVSNKQTL